MYQRKLITLLAFSVFIVNLFGQNCLLPPNHPICGQNPNNVNPPNLLAPFNTPPMVSGNMVTYDMGPGDFTVSLNCNASGAILDNRHFRDLTITGTNEITITSVDVGISLHPGGGQLEVIVYKNTGADFPNGTITPIATSGIINVPAGTGLNNAFLNVPVTATASSMSGDVVVIEVHVLPGVNGFFLGYGTDNSTTFIQAPNCSAPAITDLSNFGLPEDLNLRLHADIVPQVDPIPTMSEWGVLIFGLLILNLGVVFIYRREAVLMK